MPRWLVFLAWVGCAAELPAGEVILEIDTDLPVPEYASRLRIDVYDEGGTLLQSRDVPTRDAHLWPVSFSLVHDGEEPRTAIVRLRAYPEGKVRDYEGERWQPWDGSTPTCLVLDDPDDEEDLLPTTEPAPGLTVDLLATVTIEPHAVRRSRLTLRGACLGKMARLNDNCSSRPSLETATTCVDDSTIAVPPVSPEASLSWIGLNPSRIGTFPKNDSCPVAEESAPMVCVTGGLFILGDVDESAFAVTPTAPERPVVISTFWVDRFEVGVRDLREALLAGLRLVDVEVNDGPLTISSDWTTACTLTARPGEREDHPANCLTHADAARYCEWRGGRLLTEAEFEYVSSGVGKAVETRFPWGDKRPTCTEAVFSRAAGAVSGCLSAGPAGALPGPAPRGEGTLDINPLGIRDLAGSVSEWTLDGFAPYDGPCWTQAPLRDPRCDGSLPTSRGGSYSSLVDELAAATRNPFSPNQSGSVGLRCAYHGLP